MTRSVRMLVSAFAVFLFMLGLQVWSEPENPGIIPFELAFDRFEARQILELWREEGQAAAKRNIWLDFLFIPSYVGLFLTLTGFAMKPGGQWRSRHGRAFCAAALVAGLFDVVENICLLRILGNPEGFAAATIKLASWSAFFKFSLLALTGAALVGWVWLYQSQWFMNLPLIRWCRARWALVSALGSVLWLCRASVFGLAAGAAFLLFVPQGQDVVIGLADVRRSTRFGFFLAVGFWALNIWLWARLMVRIRWDVSSQSGGKSGKANWMRKHLPRILGTAAIGVVAVAFLKAGIDSAGDTSVYAKLVVRSLILAALFYGFTMARRTTMRLAHRGLSRIAPLQRGVSRKAIDMLEVKPSDNFSAYSDTVPIQGSFVGSITPLAVFLMVFAFAFFCFFSFSGELARRFGSAAVLLLAGGVWMPVGAFLIYIATRFRVPVMGALLVAVVVFSFFNDNHVVRTLGERSIRLPEGVTGVESHFRGWLDQRKIAETSDGLYPVIVVAAEGGGIRAAYWTATVLGRLQDQDPRFADHVYAISGVSGGSLGGAVFSALVAESQTRSRLPLPCSEKSLRRGPFEGCAHQMLSRDFLAPTLGSLMYSDLLQRFLPFPVARFDRGRALETSWEQAWNNLEGIGRSRFGTRRARSTFDDLWCNPSGECPGLYRVPLLFLNSTRVETGKRVLTSLLEIKSDEFTDAEGFFENSGQEISLSTAVHNSARFTFVSPAGTVKKKDGDVWGHLVDGGYFENSGATTALEILRAMKAGAGDLWPRLKPMVLMISNDPELGSEPEPRRFLKEATSPLVALLNTRGARGSYSRKALKDFFPEDCREERVQRIDLVGVSGIPLGWALSEGATEIMHDKATDPVARVRRALSARSRCSWETGDTAGD